MPALTTSLKLACTALFIQLLLAACGSGGSSPSPGGASSGLGTTSSIPLTTTTVPNTTTTTPPNTTPTTPPSIPTGIYPWKVWTPDPVAVPPSTTGKTYYVDATSGSNTNNGTTASAAFKTIDKGLSLMAAGDTLLIRKGLYREPIDLIKYPAISGTAAKPVTIGSYGDGEVIVDGSTKVTGWTKVSGTVWEANLSFTPVGIVVNDVPLRQVTQGSNSPNLPVAPEGIAGVTSNSGKWFLGAGFIRADMGAVIGNGDPNTADIIIPLSSQDQRHVYFERQNYLTFKGLTIRGSGSNGIWGYGSNITIENCDIKFNGKAAVSFQPFQGDASIGLDNKVLYSRAYHNILSNWPRGNNGYAVYGGGWPGALAWSGNLRAVARGNIVYKNGGEGIISYGSINGRQTGSVLFEQNASYDNWSVNMYFDNQPNNIARSNMLYNHPLNPADYIYYTTNSAVEYYGVIGKFSTCLMLADEYGSGDSATGYAALSGSQVYNNLIAGCRIGIRDYSEGSPTIANHGLKNTLIANNTIILPHYEIPNTSLYGIYLQDNGTRNTSTVIQNNLIYGFPSGSSQIGTGPLMFSQVAGPLSGITLSNNAYYTTAAKPFGAGYNSVSYYDFAGWKAQNAAEANSLFVNPMLVDITGFQAAGTAPYDYKNADLGATSPVKGKGNPQTQFNTNFTGATRSGWDIGAF